MIRTRNSWIHWFVTSCAVVTNLQYKIASPPFYLPHEYSERNNSNYFLNQLKYRQIHNHQFARKLGLDTMQKYSSGFFWRCCRSWCMKELLSNQQEGQQWGGNQTGPDFTRRWGGWTPWVHWGLLNFNGIKNKHGDVTLMMKPTKFFFQFRIHTFDDSFVVSVTKETGFDSCLTQNVDLPFTKVVLIENNNDAKSYSDVAICCQIQHVRTEFSPENSLTRIIWRRHPFERH